MALQGEQQMKTATSDNLSFVTATTDLLDQLPRFSLQPTALDAAALQEKVTIEQQEQFKMQVLKEPKCGPTWSGLEEQRSQVGIPGGARSSSTPTASSHQHFPPFPMCHQHKALGSPCFSLRRRQRVITIYGRIILLYLCLQIAGASPDQRSQKPLEVKRGDTAELSYSFSPSQNVENMQIRVTRYLPSQVVHLYEDGKDKPEKAMEDYSGRTELVRNNMHAGIVTLKIFNVRPSDSGQYCFAFQNGSFYSHTVIEMTVSGAEFISTSLITVIAGCSFSLLFSLGYA